MFHKSFWRYFSFFHQTIGNHLYLFIFVSIGVGLLDSFALALFIPLLSSVSGSSIAGESLGNLKFLTDFISFLGLSINLDTVLIFILFLFLIKGIFKFFQRKYFTFIRFIFLTKIRNQLLDDLEVLSYSGFLKIDAGRIQNILVGESGKLFSAMTNFFTTLQSSVLLFTYVLLAFVADWKFAIFVCIGSGISNYLYQYLFKKTGRISKSISQQGNDYNGYLIQAINHFKYLKVTGKLKIYFSRIRQIVFNSERLGVKIGRNDAIMEGLREPLMVAIIVAVIFVQIKLMDGSMDVILVSLLFFYRALIYLSSMQGSWQGFVTNLGSFESISELQSEMHSSCEQTGDKSIEKIKHISVQNITLRYDERIIFENLSIDVPCNSSIAFIGGSGVGKTSLANIIAGLFPPSEGKLWINGNQMLSETDLNVYRSKIGYITQEPVIFNDDIFNNVTFWADRNEENKKKFWSVIQMASLSDFIQSLPSQEETLLGDNGILISGGQKQRISIARELYKEVDVLIMDEATSALDSETEHNIQENIERLKGKYTLIIIAHRLSTIKEVDTIYLMGNKGIIAQGNFETLMEKSLDFQKMVSSQNAKLKNDEEK